MKDVSMCLYLVWTYLGNFLYKNNRSQHHVLKGVFIISKFEKYCPGSVPLGFRRREGKCVSSWLRALTPHVPELSSNRLVDPSKRAAMTLRAKTAKLIALQAGSFSNFTPFQSCEHGIYFVRQVSMVLLVLLSRISTFAFRILEIYGFTGENVSCYLDNLDVSKGDGGQWERSRGDNPHFPFLCLSDIPVIFRELMITCGSTFLLVQGAYFPSAPCGLLLLSSLWPPPKSKKVFVSFSHFHPNPQDFCLYSKGYWRFLGTFCRRGWSEGEGLLHSNTNDLKSNVWHLCS